ncbi:MAG: hypothetical protein QW279_15390 [Candidatus Jordarchaeaceae archaeon]
MKVDIISKQRNDLLKRSEVKFCVNHEKGGTPSRIEVRKNLAAILNVDEERVYINRYITGTGSMISLGEANVYDSVEQANLTEPKHIILRNTQKKEKKE